MNFRSFWSSPKKKAWDTGFGGAVVIRSAAKVCETELAKVAKTPATIRSPFWTRDLIDQAELLELQEVGPEACVGWLMM